MKGEDATGVTDDSGGNFSGGLQQGYELGSLKDGLVAYFPFDGDVEDKALNNNGTDNTSAGFVSGKIGQAKDFDGSDDKVDIADGPFDFSTSFTISMWLKANSFTNDNAPTPFDKNAITGNGYRSWLRDNGGVTFRVASGGTSYNLDSASTLSTGSWQHVVFVYNNGRQKIYVDGSEDPSQSGSSISTNNVDLALGARTDAVDFYEGQMDNVRIYDRALSTPEIQALYQRTSTQEISDQDRLTSGLVAHYPLNEEGAGKAYDLSGNNYDSISVTGTTATAGLGGAKARSFSSANGDEVHIDTSSVSLSTYSISFWANTENITADGTNGDYLFDSPDNSNRVYCYDSSQDVLNSAWGNGLMPISEWENNSWNLVTLVNHGNSEDVDFYYNGVKQTSLTGAGITLSPDFISLGGYNYEHLDGKIADFRIYSRSLTNSEVKELARQGGL